MALGFEAGKVFVRVVPDTSDFNNKLLNDLKRVKSRAEKLMQIKVTPYLDRRAMQHVKDQLNSLDGRAVIHTTVDTDGARSSVDDLSKDISNAASGGSGGHAVGLNFGDAHDGLHRFRRVVQRTINDIDHDMAAASPIADRFDSSSIVHRLHERTVSDGDNGLDVDTSDFLRHIREASEAHDGLLRRIREGDFTRSSSLLDTLPESHIEKTFSRIGQSFNGLIDRWKNLSDATDHEASTQERRLHRFNDTVRRTVDRVAEAIAHATSGQFDDDDSIDVTDEFFRDREGAARRNRGVSKRERRRADSISLPDKVEVGSSSPVDFSDIQRNVRGANRALLEQARILERVNRIGKHVGGIKPFSDISRRRKQYDEESRAIKNQSASLNDEADSILRVNNQLLRRAGLSPVSNVSRETTSRVNRHKRILADVEYEQSQARRRLFNGGDRDAVMRHAYTPRRLETPKFSNEWLRQFRQMEAGIHEYEAEQSRFINRTKRAFADTNRRIVSGAKRSASEAAKAFAGIDIKNIASFGDYRPGSKLVDRDAGQRRINSARDKVQNIILRVKDQSADGLRRVTRNVERGARISARVFEQRITSGFNRAFDGTAVYHGLSKVLNGDALREVNSFKDRVSSRAIRFKTEFDTSGFNAVRNLERDMRDFSLRAARRTIRIGFEVSKDPIRVLKRLIRDIPNEINTRVDADTAEARHRIDELTESQDVTVNADADTLRAKAKLARLTRPRFVEIFPQLNKAATAKVATTLAALSGARATKDFLKNFTDFGKDLDKNLGSLIRLSLIITNLSSLVVSLTSHIFTLGAGILSIIPAVAALPGMVSGFAVGAIVLVNALSEWNKRLKDVNKRFEELNKRASNNFWDKAEKPIREMIDNLFPAWERGILEVGNAFGDMFAGIAQSVQQHLGSGALDQLFDHLIEGIREMSKGMDPFIEGFIRLGDIGGQFLPRFGMWFTDMANRFNDWTKNADISGAIERSIQAIKDLWRALTALAGIFVEITRAAQDAGGAGLGDFADALERIRDGLKTVESQWTLTTLFRGANEAASNLGPTLDTIGHTFYELADNIANAMGDASESLNSFVSFIGGAFQTPEFQEGFDSAFDGVREGMGDLKEGAEPLGKIMGDFGNIIGLIAREFLPLFSTALKELAPIFDDIYRALKPVIPVLSEALKSAIEWLGEHLEPLVKDIADWAEKNPELAATLGTVAVAVGLLVSALAPVFGSLFGILGSIGGLIPLGTALGEVLGGVAAAFGEVLVPILVVIGIIALLAAAFINAWNTSEDFRKSVENMWKALSDLGQPVADFWNNTLVPAFQEIGQGIIDGLKPIGDELTPIFTDLSDILTKVFEAAKPFLEWLNDVLGPVISDVAKYIGDAFRSVGNIIGSVLGVVGGIIRIFKDLVLGNFNSLGDDMVNLMNKAWGLVKSVTEGTINWIGDLLLGAIQWFLRLFGGWGDDMANKVRESWEQVKSFFNRPMSDILGDVGRWINDLVGKFNLGDLWNSGWNMLVDFANGIASGFRKAINSVKNGMKNIRNFFPFSPAKTGPFSGRGYVTHSAAAMMGDFADALISQRGKVDAAAEYALSGAASRFGAEVASGNELKSVVRESLEVDLTGQADSISGSVVGALRSGVTLSLDENSNKAIMRLSDSGARRDRRVYA